MTGARWTDIVEGLLFVLVLHELFMRQLDFERQDAIIKIPLKIGNTNGLLPEGIVKTLIVILMVILVIVTHIKPGNDQVGPASAMSCNRRKKGALAAQCASSAMSHGRKKRMVKAFNPRSDAQGRPDAHNLIME